MPEKLDTIMDVLDRHDAGESFSPYPTSGNGEEYDIVDNVAIISVHGTLLKRIPFPLSSLSGLASMREVGELVNRADNDQSVDAIVLDIDSPGGTVDGTAELAGIVAGTKKPVIAYVDGLAASAAYWIASQTDAIVLSSETAEVGSIGVVVMHVDRSGADAKAGIKRTYITAGKYKRIGNDAEPLADDAKEYISERLDIVYRLFVASVAKGRGTTEESVLSDMADGRIFLGSEAIGRGMVDSIGTFSGAVEMAASAAANRRMERIKMDYQEITGDGLRQERPGLVAELVDAASAEILATERDRVSKILEMSDDQPALSLELILAGASIEDAACRMISDAKERRRKESEVALREDAETFAGIQHGGDPVIVEKKNHLAEAAKALSAERK